MIRTLAIGACAALCTAAAQAETITRTGERGGSVVIERDCAPGGGRLSCASTSTYTGPEGRTATRERVWSGNRNGASGTATWTDGQGRTTVIDRTRSRTALGGTSTATRIGPRGNTGTVTRSWSR